MPTAPYPLPIEEFALPYVPAASPLDTRPHLISGSNVIMNPGGWLSRRPGFTKYATNAIAGTINNIFIYRRWNSTSYIMLSVATATDSQVYKLQVGVDAQFALLTSTVGTTERWDFDISGDILYFCNGTDNKKWDGTTVTNWGIAGGATAPAASYGAGALTSTQGGWSWVYCFGNNTTGHIGARSPESVSTGNVSAKQFTITGANTSDAQVDKVHIFRSFDGDDTFLYELPNSPIAYVPGWSIVDTATDAQLQTDSISPLFNQNLRPSASKGVVFHASRLWTFAGSYVYYSAFEELINGVSAESFPLENRYDFGVEITKIVRAGKCLLVYTRTTIWRIRGDSLDTFYRDILLNSYGAPNRGACTNSGKAVAFYETNGSIMVTDAVSMLVTLSSPIAPDVDSFSQSSVSVVFHRQGRRSWFVIQDGNQNKMWLFDVQMGYWNVPWSFGGTAIWSGEVSSGVSRLLVAKNGYVYYLDPTTFADDNTGYTCSVTTGLLNLVPPQGDPDWVGSLEYVTLRSNSIEPSTVSYQIDDDPFLTTHTAIQAAGKYKRPERRQGVNLVEKNYKVRNSGVHASIKIDWDASKTEWKLYSGALVPEGVITGVSG